MCLSMRPSAPVMMVIQTPTVLLILMTVHLIPVLMVEPVRTMSMVSTAFVILHGQETHAEKVINKINLQRVIYSFIEFD
mgnify:FL=1